MVYEKVSSDMNFVEREKQVEKLGNALYMLILDNSEMFGEG